MSSTEIISLIVTFIGIFSFATIFTILYGNYASMSIAELNSGKRDIELIDEVIYERQEKVKRRKEIFSKNPVFFRRSPRPSPQKRSVLSILRKPPHSVFRRQNALFSLFYAKFQNEKVAGKIRSIRSSASSATQHGFSPRG